MARFDLTDEEWAIIEPLLPVQGRGSEFKAEFEQACADKGLFLYELPPKSPKLNGAVERCNGAWRYEFYAVYDLQPAVSEINPILEAFQNIYNYRRPHGALEGKTPADYLKSAWAGKTSPSHMRLDCARFDG